MSSPNRNESDRIESFLAGVRRRINLRSFSSAAVWSLAGVSAATLAVALAYVVQGYAVDRRWYLVAAVAAVGATLVAWLVRLATSEAAARFADRFFGLQDGLISALHFRREGKTEGFYALQQEQTSQRVEGLKPDEIDWRPDGRAAVVAVLLAVVAVGMAWKKPSEEVQNRIEQENFTLASTERMNKELEEELDQLNEQLNDPLEKEMIEPDKLREMVDSLGRTKDQKEALRQYAKLEQMLKQQLAKLEQKNDEHLMDEVAKELEKARETKPLGESLKAKKYDKAAKELANMKPKAAPKLSEQQKELAKLRAASKRMAAAVRNQRGRMSSGNPGRSAKAGESAKAASSARSGKSGQASGSGGSSGGKLGDAIEDLDAALAEWDGALKELERLEEIDLVIDPDALEECEACKNCALSELDKLSKYLKRMAVKKNAQCKLALLCEKCSECQGGLCRFWGKGAGAKGAGFGSSLAERQQRDELIDNGQTEALKGIKGQGPSQTTVETADEGTGTASRGAVAKQREFRSQVESFVTREDVPEEVRTGVKQYFEAIHQIQD